MNICLCTDENYAPACGACLFSFFEHHKTIGCKAYILAKTLSEQAEKNLKAIGQRFGQEVNIIYVETELLRHLKVSERFPESIYYRFLLPSLIPADKLLYLDCDIICNAPAVEFWNIDLTGMAMAAIEDQNGADIRLLNTVGNPSVYFNSGVLLLNAAYWRENNIAQQLADELRHNGIHYPYPDQDALNTILRDRVIIADFRYNFQEALYRPESKLMLHRDKWEAVGVARKDPVFIHYTAAIKPWYQECNHPQCDLYRHYQKLTPWGWVPLRRYYPLSQELKHAFSRILRVFCSCLPHCMRKPLRASYNFCRGRSR